MTTPTNHSPSEKGIAVTAHCVERYIERVKPMATRKQAESELEVLIANGLEVPQLPWEAGPQVQQDFRYFIELSDGIAVGVMDETAVTLFTRGGTGTGYRQHKNHLRKNRQAKQRGKELRHKVDKRQRATPESKRFGGALSRSLKDADVD